MLPRLQAARPAVGSRRHGSDACAAQVFRADKVKLADHPVRGARRRAEFTGAWQVERRTIPAGSLFVPIDQPRAPLLMQLLEPASPDSLVAWGFFHAAFEQKEYMEDYVAEEEARKMMARDPELRSSSTRRWPATPSWPRIPGRG